MISDQDIAGRLIDKTGDIDIRKLLVRFGQKRGALTDAIITNRSDLHTLHLERKVEKLGKSLSWVAF
jgi:hypothetical protein